MEIILLNLFLLIPFLIWCVIPVFAIYKIYKNPKKVNYLYIGMAIFIQLIMFGFLKLLILNDFEQMTSYSDYSILIPLLSYLASYYLIYKS